ncbi:MAG TPA: hypothetical protein VFQ44_03605 [Streptosporangiaceae bacterium]|nr:hypothetical protein [Streptosporangiaceae bacterium]
MPARLKQVQPGDDSAASPVQRLAKDTAGEGWNRALPTQILEHSFSGTSAECDEADACGPDPAVATGPKRRHLKFHS